MPSFPKLGWRPGLIATLCVLILAGEGWMALQVNRWAADALRQRARQAGEWRRLDAEASAWVDDTGPLAAVQARAGKLRALLFPEPYPPRSERNPTSTDALVRVAELIEGLRTRAAAGGLQLRPDEDWGLASFRTTAPAQDQVGAILDRCDAIETVGHALVEAGAKALLHFDVGGPESSGAVATRNAAGLVRSGPGVLVPAGLSLRIPGRVEVIPMRVGFRGDTGVLRQFLESLGDGAAPVAVRGVECAPSSDPVGDDEGPRSEWPLVVARRDTDFTLVLEAMVDTRGTLPGET